MIIITIEAPDGTGITIPKGANVTLSDGTNTIEGVRGMVLSDVSECVNFNTPLVISPAPKLKG